MSVVDARNRHAVLLFEVFPPRTDAGMAQLRGEGGVLDRLYTLHPDAIACTYGAGGVDFGKNLVILDKIREDGKCAPVTYFSCAGNTKQSAVPQLRACLEHGVRGLLVQDENLPAGEDGVSRLVCLIRQEFGSRFTVSVPGAPDSPLSMETELARLRRAQDCGADTITTRLCWDMDAFRCWLDGIRAAGITMPVTVSVLPVLDQAETVSTVLSHSGSALPESLSRIISDNWILPNPFVKDPFDAAVERKKADFKKAGLEYTLSQIRSYLSCGVSGIQLLTRNRFEDAALIVKEAGLRP